MLKRVRELLENQKHKDNIANIVAVNENKIVVDMRNESSESKLLPFFISEKDAIQFLMHKKLSD